MFCRTRCEATEKFDNTPLFKLHTHSLFNNVLFATLKNCIIGTCITVKPEVTLYNCKLCYIKLYHVCKQCKIIKLELETFGKFFVDTKRWKRTDLNEAGRSWFENSNEAHRLILESVISSVFCRDPSRKTNKGYIPVLIHCLINLAFKRPSLKWEFIRFESASPVSSQFSSIAWQQSLRGSKSKNSSVKYVSIRSVST